VTEFLAALEATPLAAHLRVSRWTYPLVNAGHIAGIGLLLGAVVPMDLRALRLVGGPDLGALVRFLRPFAVAGLILALICGLLLFSAQATDYAGNLWFRLKMALLAAALLNAALHLRLEALPPARQRRAAALSLLLWPAVLLSGRLIAFA
jgi:hypothetical protein